MYFTKFFDNKKQIASLEAKIKILEENNKRILKSIENFRNMEENKIENKNEMIKQLSIHQISILVEEMLNDEDINISYLPDFVEKQIYTNVFQLIMSVVEKSLTNIKLEFLKHNITLKVEPISIDN